MAEPNDPENVPEVAELVAEIDSHSRRIKDALQHRLAATTTPEDALAVLKELGAELFETMIPLWADFSKSAAMEISDLNDEVFGVKLPQEAAEDAHELLTEYQLQNANNPQLVARIQGVLDVLDGGGEGDDGDEDGDEEEDETN